MEDLLECLFVFARFCRNVGVYVFVGVPHMQCICKIHGALRGIAKALIIVLFVWVSCCMFVLMLMNFHLEFSNARTYL